MIEVPPRKAKSGTVSFRSWLKPRRLTRYFFNFDNDSAAVADLVGRELPDDEAAKQEAAMRIVT